MFKITNKVVPVCMLIEKSMLPSLCNYGTFKAVFVVFNYYVFEWTIHAYTKIYLHPSWWFQLSCEVFRTNPTIYQLMQSVSSTDWYSCTINNNKIIIHFLQICKPVMHTMFHIKYNAMHFMFHIKYNAMQNILKENRNIYYFAQLNCTFWVWKRLQF